MTHEEDAIVFNIRHYFDADGILGEDVVQSVLSDFYCYKNRDVESFLKEQAVNFTKKNQSVTYVVLSKQDLGIMGYFTLAIKPLTINLDDFSKTVQKKIARVSKIDKKIGEYTFSAYLIAQLGKNFAYHDAEKLTGKALLNLAVEQIKEIQYMAGGMVYFLEAENNPKLLKFYEDHGFKRFATKNVERNDGEQHTLVQLLKIL